MKAALRKVLSGDFGLFAEKSDKDFFALAMLGAVAITPFALYYFLQDRAGLGLLSAGIVAWFLLNGIALYRGRRLMPAPAVFLPVLGVLVAAMILRPEVAVFWSYPAILLFHFILERRVANLYNASIALATVPCAYAAYGAEVAVRVAVTVVLTIAFSNVFSYLTERQRRKEIAQERELCLERDRLALLVHATQAGFTDWDAEANVVNYSERFKELLGYPRDADTSGWPPFFERMHPDDRPRVEAEFRAMLKQKRAPGLQQPGQALDYRLRRADGSYVWLHAESIAQVDESLRVKRFITSYQDVSKFREQEALQRDQAKFIGDVLDSVPVGLAMRDLDGRYLFVNRAWETFTGSRRADVVGKTVHDRAPKDEADRVVAEDRLTLARGPDAPQVLQDLVYNGRRFLLTRTVMTDAEGAVRGVLVASVDASERYAMEQALANEQRRLELVVRAGSIGFLDWDGVARTAYYSRRFKEILGYPGDADTSAWPDFFDRVHPEDRPRVKARFREHIVEKRAEEHEPTEYRLRRADGSYVWVEAVGLSVRDERGYATRFIASIRDVSDRRAEQEALRESVRLREEVERMSRHDLKTPLNAIIAVPRLLREGRSLSAEERELLSIVERAGYRILNLVNLSLDLFRMEQGRYTFRPQAIDIAELVEKVVADLESQAASKAVTIAIDRAPEAVRARGEELLCYSMLANLIKNAIEASPEGGTVTVTIDAGEGPGGGARVHVHNAGAVPEPVRESFFEKYSTAGKPEGVGLGTYSALLMARVQEGNITMRTSAEEGTTLSVHLTAANPETASAGAASGDARDERHAAALPPLEVLVVDDDEFNRLVMRRYLPSPPLTVEMAVNGRAALDALRRKRFDFVFLDLEMPVMSGYEAAQRIRALEKEAGRKPCTLVAFSSNDDETSIRRALAAGCDHYLAKPAGREALRRLLSGEAPATHLAAETASAAPSDPVEVDAVLRPTLPAFFVSRRAALDEIGAALARGKRAEARRLAHKLAGSFSLYGFRWAAAECRALERSLAAGTAQEPATRLDAVRKHLDSARLDFVDTSLPAA